jgi:hypothetical protein
VYQHTNPNVPLPIIGQKDPSLHPFFVYLTNDVTFVDRIKRGRSMLSLRKCFGGILQPRLGPEVQLLFEVTNGHTKQIPTWPRRKLH